MFNVSPSAADLWFGISNIALILGAVAVALGTYGAITMGAVKEQFASERIAESMATAAKANEAAALANERAAKLEKEAAEMKVSLQDARSEAVGLAMIL